ncbi:MAG: hypothetical protein IJD63_00800 [Oscillospiraceae bacterium]|nr:hypothetical protein [Oscillospiraceae bacterium]
MARYRIADLIVDISLSGRTRQQAMPYLTEEAGEADIVLSCDCERVLQKYPHFGDLDMAEYMTTGSLFAVEMLRFYGFQLHASAVMLQGKAYLFSAPSGTGKSTHTEKWCRLFGAQVLNDDKPVLRRVDGVWTVYGTPWSGKNDLSCPVGVPLGGVAYLSRGEVNAIYPMAATKAVPAILSQCMQFSHKGCAERQLELVDLLLRETPIWQLFCRNDDEAATVSYEAMKNGSK